MKFEDKTSLKYKQAKSKLTVGRGGGGGHRPKSIGLEISHGVFRFRN